MKQWFTGKFRGHYRGHPTKPSELSPFIGAPHFRIEVYEALVSDITLGPLSPSPPPPRGAKGPGGESDEPTESAPYDEVRAHHEPQGPVLYQSHIGKVHLVDPVQPGQMVRSTAHDVLMSGFELSRGAESTRGSLGHIEGTISGWYRPPPPPKEVEELPPLDGPPPVGWKTEVLEREAAPKAQPSEANFAAEKGFSVPSSQGASGAKGAPRARGAPSALSHAKARKADEEKSARLDEEIDSEEALDAALSEEAPSVEYPFFSIGMVITLLLAFFATPFSAVLFGLTFLLSYGVRRWLLGVVPDVAAVRVLALFLGSTQILVAALVIARFSTLGCVSLSPFPLIWLLGAQMTASFLPRPLPFALTTVGFAAVLFQAYGSWAPPPCRSEVAPAALGETAPEDPRGARTDAAPPH